MTVEMVKELIDALERVTETLEKVLDGSSIEDIMLHISDCSKVITESRNLIARAKLSLRNSRNP